MATTTAMNKWIEELVTSLLPTNTPPSKLRKLKSQFGRNIRHHNFGRTNQFLVEERLTGLEEKFQVLDHDDLSDAIHRRRDELRLHFDQWIPDALDFLLHMSRDPLTAGGLAALQNVVIDDLVTPQLTWAEIEKDDPINRKDRMWRMPHFSDESSDEEIIESSAPSSPESAKRRNAPAAIDLLSPQFEVIEPSETLESLRSGMLSAAEGDITITEIQAIRETLFMLQGFPTTLYAKDNRSIKLNTKYKIVHMSILSSVASKAILMSKAAGIVRSWVFVNEKEPFVEVLEDRIHVIAQEFDDFLAQSQSEVIASSSNGGVCSLLEVIDSVYQNARSIIMAAQFVTAGKGQDAIGLVEIACQQACRLELFDQQSAFRPMLKVFCETLKAFVVPVSAWVEQGILPERPSCFFVERAQEQDEKAKLWHNWYLYHSEGPKRLPDFLQQFSQRMFVAGKTMAFIKALPQEHKPTHAAALRLNTLASAVENAYLASTTSLAPFAPTLLANIQHYVDEHLDAATSAMQQMLDKHFSLTDTLSALSHLYFAEAPYATSCVEEQTFGPLDRGRPGWNDRFLILDIMQEAFDQVPCIDSSRIIVQSHRLPVADLMQARLTVKILQNIAIEYTIPWPIANILSTDSIASYRRVALMLMQIRRAKYVLERCAFPNLAKHASSKISVEGIYPNLRLFTDILYAHLMHCVVGPLTAKMRQRIYGTVDEMIAVHKTYTTALERACFTAKNLKVLRETLVSLLDLCVGFGFQVAEATSELDGFALSKVKTQFRKLMNLLIAGLRGSARAGLGSSHANGSTTAIKGGLGAEVGDLLDLLADSLESAAFKM
ncbi:uncharacterized protein HMPREF1541_10778 [Cyphellophora europaea CBS 101466]|uniref:Spindle pole body component n=1 Tax=Cyphellophora europaea (strain CBS 101466) TaxID=1220924 RepID=W2S6A3_CYPE1|nr:uncharacterized protein HMPREF1541_10778 [Cyphellophora europaea CBS 101466]ETN44227.1 hypothetical protein HMPREF1541_10778 [Cyphellophora europaea CBS 101466]